MASTWLKYQNNENATAIFNLDHSTHFRHVAAGDESFIEIYADGTMHSILKLTDPAAYETALGYIAMTTSYKLD